MWSANQAPRGREKFKCFVELSTQEFHVAMWECYQWKKSFVGKKCYGLCISLCQTLAF